MKNSARYYSVGALLYCPANRQGIVQSVEGGQFGRQYSLALCLEDTVPEHQVDAAEGQLSAALRTLLEDAQQGDFYLPKVFVRVRAPEQIPRLLERLGCGRELLSGLILPKFSPVNAPAYLQAVERANENAQRPLYLMPILESPDLIPPHSRGDTLHQVKELLAPVEPLVLNVRVGGNDLCNCFGFRRHSDETIYGIRPVAQILTDIVTVFGTDYVVSGPVWEYYHGQGWDTGLARELEEDRLCGFVGKTVIHPNQIPLVNRAYQVPYQDWVDAKSILGWDGNAKSLVFGSANGARMNEVQTHACWAQRMLYLAEVYGVQPELGGENQAEALR